MTRMLEAAAGYSGLLAIGPEARAGHFLVRSPSFGRPKAVKSLSVCGLFSSKEQIVSSSSLRSRIRAHALNGDDGGQIELIKDKFLAPLKPDSPSGLFLMQTLKENPHLFIAAAEQQLQQLSDERSSQEQPNLGSPDFVLYKRIAQLKAEERRRAVQEVIYALVVQRFVKSGIKLVPKISAILNKDGGASWHVQVKELEAVHSSEAFEMIKDHMEMVLGGQKTLSRVEPQTVAKISKLRVGQIYATSVMYGYFLKRVDERYQLEKKMKILTTASDSVDGVSQFLSIEKRNADEAAAAVEAEAELRSSSAPVAALRPNSLRSYVGGFDKETLSRYATMRTHETVDLIERHAEALFGRPDLKVGPDGSVGLARDDAIRIKFASLRTLVLEAAAFGSYLWEVESFVDTHYSLVPRRK